jgi:NitT/TauT family transport system substrate-binding protein
MKKMLLLLVVGAMLAAGCGDDDGGDEAEATGDDAAEAGEEAAAAETCDNETVVYQLGFIPNAQYAGFLLALQQGYFEEEGVNLEMRPGGPTVNPALQLAQGNVDMADIPLSEALNAVSEGADLRLVGQTAQQNPLRYIAMKEVGLTEPTALEGKIVEQQQTGSIPGELFGLLFEAGLTEDDIQTQMSEFTTDDFVAGATEVFPLRIYGHIAMLEAAGLSYPDDVDVLDPNEFEESAIADEGMYVNGEFLDENPEAVTCVLRAAQRGWADAIADPDAAKDAVTEFTPEGAFTEEDISVNTDFTLDPYVSKNPQGEEVEPLSIDVDFIQESAEKLQRAGTVEGEVDVDAVIETEPLEAAGS